MCGPIRIPGEAMSLEMRVFLINSRDETAIDPGRYFPANSAAEFLGDSRLFASDASESLPVSPLQEEIRLRCFEIAPLTLIFLLHFHSQTRETALNDPDEQGNPQRGSAQLTGTKPEPEQHAQPRARGIFPVKKVENSVKRNATQILLPPPALLQELQSPGLCLCRSSSSVPRTSSASLSLSPSLPLLKRGFRLSMCK